VRKETFAVSEMMELLLRSGAEYEQEMRAETGRACELRRELSERLSDCLEVYQSVSVEECAGLRTNTILDQQFHRLLTITSPSV
jgi:hypothetical protein